MVGLYVMQIPKSSCINLKLVITMYIVEGRSKTSTDSEAAWFVRLTVITFGLLRNSNVC